VEGEDAPSPVTTGGGTAGSPGSSRLPGAGEYTSGRAGCGRRVKGPIVEITDCP